MKVLILGGRGMAGHVVTSYFQKHTVHDVSYTSRDADDLYGYYLDASDLDRVRELIMSLKPDIVINCIGILNEFAVASPKDAILVNSYLPHHVSTILDGINGKLIHISTDCVFSGTKGKYRDTDEPDGTSVYARTKQLGEVTSGRHITIRTSIIGPELKNGIGLFHWFMKQQGIVNGYTNVWWNGVTTLELAKAIKQVIDQDITGLYQLTAPEIVSKYELLAIIQKVFQKTDVQVKPFEAVPLDRTLVSLRQELTSQVPEYKKMLLELKEWMEGQ